MKVVAVVPAAGEGSRLKSTKPKPLVVINGKPVLIHTLSRINSHPRIKSIIVAVNKNYRDAIIKAIRRYHLDKVKFIVAGGKTRTESVKNCLQNLPLDTDIVLIHDGVRPFVTHKIIDATLNAAKSFGAAVAGVPIKPTLKKVYGKKNLFVEETLERKSIWEIQTPQAFKKDLILKAYNRFKHLEATDDAMLIEKLGKRVRLIQGSYFNIKITTPDDLVFAKAILKTYK